MYMYVHIWGGGQTVLSTRVPHSATTPSTPPHGAACSRVLITEFIKEVSPLLPNLCHHQDYDRSISPGARHSRYRFWDLGVGVWGLGFEV